MKVLLLGGSQFVGRAIRDELVASGADVSAITRGLLPTEWGSVRHIACDRRDTDALRHALREEYEVVVDVSGYTSDDILPVLSALPSAPRCYILISSAAVYVRATSQLPFSEETGDIGGDPSWGDYGEGKSEAERVLLDRLGDRVIIFRPPYIYGPHNNLDRETFLWARILRGSTIYLPGDGQCLIQFCDVGVLSRAVARAAVDSSFPRGVLNIGDSSYVTFLEWVTAAADAIGFPMPQIDLIDGSVAPARSFFPLRDQPLVLDVNRWRSLAVHEELTLRNGLASTYAWAVAAGRVALEPTPFEIARSAGAP